jgi:hypothetical protein
LARGCKNLKELGRVLLEVGPGNLTALAKQQFNGRAEIARSLLRHPEDPRRI